MEKYQNLHSSCNLSISIKRTNGQFEVIFRSANKDSFWQALSRFKRTIRDTLRRYDASRRLWIVSFYAEDELCLWVEEMQVEWSAEVSPAASWRRLPQKKEKRVLRLIPPETLSLEQAYRMLNLTPGAPLESVKRAWWKLAAIHLPAKSNNLEPMQYINSAFELIKKHIEGGAQL
jgi:hypothetical protein